MAIHKCKCHFIPPAVLDKLGRAGIETARASVMQSKITRDKRSSRVLDMATFASAQATGKAEREVYDCKHMWQLRVKKVRGENDGPAPDGAVNEVFDSAGIVRKYYKEVLSRNSIDDRKMNLILNVHYGTDYMNAFWDGDEMVFGDGDGNIFVSFTKSLDVVAHELAHGVTQFTADLEYQGQSGALNEHFSDVFGTAITQYAKGQEPGEADWLIGDEIMGPELYGEALRSMSSPGTAYDNSLLGKDPQPDHMRDYYAGSDDNQGVHINSGIPNKAFYLVAMRIGTDKGALLWYESLKKLWATAKFNDAVGVIVDTARILTRDGKIPLGSPQIVRSSFREVGLPT